MNVLVNVLVNVPAYSKSRCNGDGAPHPLKLALRQLQIPQRSAPARPGPLRDTPALASGTSLFARRVPRRCASCVPSKREQHRPERRDRYEQHGDGSAEREGGRGERRRLCLTARRESERPRTVARRSGCHPARKLRPDAQHVEQRRQDADAQDAGHDARGTGQAGRDAQGVRNLDREARHVVLGEGGHADRLGEAEHARHQRARGHGHRHAHDEPRQQRHHVGAERLAAVVGAQAARDDARRDHPQKRRTGTAHVKLHGARPARRQKTDGHDGARDECGKEAAQHGHALRGAVHRHGAHQAQRHDQARACRRGYAPAQRRPSKEQEGAAQ
mmetsp:Transcript_3521/g.14278  ORF Transcript_3521/g.14278 Transcript_3521/m.14278 type:complete len:331 (-) Transcript_3521:596-1588(-)